MARIRTLKPEILEDEKVSRLSDTAYRLFVSMIVLADDHGHVRADAGWLKAQIWWAHPNPPNVLVALLEIWKAGLIDVYAVRGGTYAALLGWKKHQRVDNAGKGRVPAPNDADAQRVNEQLCPIGQSRKSAASRGEMPLDQEGDQEEEEERDPPRSAASPPISFLPREGEKRLATKLELDVEAEAEAFSDYYASKGTRLADVHAAFRGWLRRAHKFKTQDKPTAEVVDMRDL